MVEWTCQSKRKPQGRIGLDVVWRVKLQYPVLV